MNCNDCGFELPAHAKFCLSCGTKVSVSQHCRACQTELPIGAKFCIECGAVVDFQESGPPTSVDSQTDACQGKASGATTINASLDYEFVGELEAAFRESLDKESDDSSDDIHKIVQQYAAGAIRIRLRSGLATLDLALSRALSEFLSPSDLAALRKLVEKEGRAIAARLEPSLKELEGITKRVLEEVPRTLLESAFRTAIGNLGGIVMGATASGGPWGALPALASGVRDHLHANAEQNRILDEWLEAHEAIMKAIAVAWENLYGTIHRELKSRFGIVTPSFRDLEERMARYENHLQDAHSCLDDDRYDDALLKYDAALKELPGEATPLLGKLHPLFMLERWSEILSVVQELEKCSQPYQKRNALPDYYASYAFDRLERFEEEKECLTRIVSAKVESIGILDECHFRLSRLLLTENQHPLAATHLRKALSHGYDNLNVLNGIIDQYVAIDEDERINLLNQAVANGVARIVKECLLGEAGTDFKTPDEFGAKLSKAKSSYVCLGDEETLLCLYDSTVFGGAKDGVALSDWTLYWKELFQDPVHLSFCALKDVTENEHHLVVNGEHAISIVPELTRKALLAALLSIREYLSDHNMLTD